MKRNLLFVVIALFIITIAACQREKRPASGGLLLPNEDSIKQLIPLAESGRKSFAGLPPAVDMQPVLPPAGDQGTQGSCVSWAIGYELMSYYERFATGQTDYGVANDAANPNKVYSPAFIFNYLKDGVYPPACSHGIQFTSAFNTVMRVGNCRWIECPYKLEDKGCVGGVSKANVDSAAKHRNYQFNRIYKRIDDIKSWLSDGYPVIIGIFTSADFETDGDAAPKNQRFIWNPAKNDKDAYHAMLIVGYDEKYFKLMNSFGTKWGTAGYAWIPQQALIDRTIETYVAERSPERKGRVEIEYETLRRFTNKATVNHLLKGNTRLQFDNFSLKVRPMDQTNGFEYYLYDSTQAQQKLRAQIEGTGSQKFYVSDSLISIYSNLKNDTPGVISIQVRIDSGKVDDNLKMMDSTLSSSYAYLKAKKDRTPQDEQLLYNFDNWKSGYRHPALRISSTFWNNQLTGLVVLLFLLMVGVVLFIRQGRKRKKSNLGDGH